MEEINKENKIQQKIANNTNLIRNPTRYNLNNKYDSALLEELNNSKTKSWRIDIINATQEENKENRNNNIQLNEQKENDIINNKVDRFKDFDEILILEENKDKKRKNHSMEKIENIPKPSEKKNSNEKKLIQENININNRNSSTLSELNQFIGNNNNNNSQDLESKKK